MCEKCTPTMLANSFCVRLRSLRSCTIFFASDNMSGHPLRKRLSPHRAAQRSKRQAHKAKRGVLATILPLTLTHSQTCPLQLATLHSLEPSGFICLFRWFFHALTSPATSSSHGDGAPPVPSSNDATPLPPGMGPGVVTCACAF